MAQENNPLDSIDNLANSADFLGPAKIGVNLPKFETVLPQNPDYLIKDNTVGSAPNLSQKSVAPFQTNTNNKAQATAQRMKAILNGNVDNTKYNSSYLFDSSPTGAHRARYKAYGQKTFDRIGFRPDIDNESWFNQNTTVWDDTKRMLRHSAGPLLGIGFLDPIKSYGKILSDFDFTGDPDSAAAYEDYSNLGYSTKGGVGGFMVNLGNSAAYSLGVMAEGVIEGALIGGAVGFATGGVSAIPGAAIGGITGGFKNLLKLPGALADTSKNIAKILSNLEKMKDINLSRNVWKNAGKTMGNFINPFSNSKDALQQYVFNNTDDLSNLARASKTMGGFLFDVRNINMALSEGRLEGGFSENAIYQKLYNDYYKEHGEVAPDDLQKQFRNQAKQGSLFNTFANTALVFYSNRIAFPSMMNAKFLKGVPKFSRVTGKIGDYNLIYKPGKKLEDAVWLKEKASLANSLKSLKSPSTYGRAGLSYFKANLMEGFQEVGQNILQDYTTEYYTQSFNNPAVKNFYYSMGLLKNSLDKSISPEGFEAFMSGFAMGTILQGPHKLMGFVNNQINKFKNREAYTKYGEQYEQVAQDAVDALNEMTKNGKLFLDPRIQNYGAQFEVATLIDADDTTTKDAQDKQFESFYSAVRTSIQTGTFEKFLENFEGFKQYTPKEIEEAWSLKEGQGEIALANIDKAIGNAKVIKNKFDYFTSKFKPGPNPADLPEGSLEQIQAMLYNKAYNISIQNAVWSGEAFKDNLERIGSITDKLSKIDAIKNSRFGTFAAIYDNTVIDPVTGKMSIGSQRLDREIEILKSETEALIETKDPKASLEISNNQALISALEEFRNARNEFDTSTDIVARKVAKDAVKTLEKAGDKEEATKLNEDIEDIFKGSEKVIAYKKAFENLIKTLAKVQGGQASTTTELDIAENLDDYFTDLVDLHVLNAESNVLSKYASFLANPEEFYEHLNRNYEWVTREYNNRKETFKRIINEEFHNEIKNDVLKNLAERGIFVDLDQFADWVEDNSVLPEYFIDVKNEAFINQDSIFYNEYAKIFIEASKLLAKNPAGDPATSEEQLNEKLSELQKEKATKLQQAFDKYNSDLKKATGFTEEEIKERNKLAQSQNTEELEALKTKLEEAKSLLTDLNTTDIEVLGGLQERIQKVVLVTGEDINTYLNELDDKAFKKLENKAAQLLNKIKEQLPENEQNDPAVLERLYQFAFTIETIKAQGLIKNEVDNLEKEISEKDQASEIEFIDIESLPVYIAYQEAVAKINEEYANVEKTIKDEYAPSVSAEVKPMSTDMEWDELDTELRLQLQPAFVKFLATLNYTQELQDTDEEQYNKLRKNWLETQGDVIEKYNQTKQAKFEERKAKMSTAPEFKFLSNDDNLNVITLKELNSRIDFLNSLVESGEITDGKKTYKLTKEQIEDIKSDIETLGFYMDNRRNNFVPLKEYEQVILEIQERVLDRQDELEIITDADGNVISRKLKDQPEGTSTERPSKLAEELDLEINDKEPFRYNQIDVVLRAFDNSQSPEVKTDSFAFFIQAFKDLKINQYPLSKIEKIEEELKQNFTKENLERLLIKYSFKERTGAGSLIDNLTRTFLTPNPAGGFMQISKPDNMSEEAFDSLFGRSGIITKIRDGMIDGEYYLLANNFTIFDRNLRENGVAGEVDILAITVDQETGKPNLQIVDIKTAKSWASWETGKDSDTSTAYRAQQSIYKNILFNMTGIEADINLLPLQVNVDADGYISKVTLSPIVEKQNKEREAKGLKGLDTYKLEYLPEVENKGIIKIQPTFETKPVARTEEGKVIEEQGPTNVEAESKDYTLDEALGMPVIYQGQEGKLTFNEDGTYTVETIKDDITVINDINLNGLPIKDGKLFISSLGLSVLRQIEQPGQITVDTNNELLDIKFTSKSETEIIANGITYKVNRDKTQSIVSFTYRTNDKAIQEIDDQLGLLNEELKSIRSELSSITSKLGEEVKKDPSLGLAISKKRTSLLADELNLTDEISALVKKRQELFANNFERTLRGEKANEFIFALNKLPNTYQKNSSKDTKVDTIKDAKTINSISAVSSVSEAITNMMAEEYPSEVDKLLEEGVDSISIDDLFKIVNWGQETIAKLEAYALNLIDRNIPITDVEDQIIGLNAFLNDLRLINITKDGKISKRQKEAKQIFGVKPKSVSQRTDISKDVGVEQRPAETVSGPTTGEEVKKSIKTVRKSKKSAEPTSDELLLRSLLEEVDKPKPEVLIAIENAKTAEELDSAKAKAFLFLSTNPGVIGAADVANAFKKKYKELMVDININSVTKNMYLMGLVPIFTDKVGDIVYIKSIKGDTITVQDIYSKKTKKYSIDELAKNFTKTTEMAIEEQETKVEITEKDVQDSEESKDVIKDLMLNGQEELRQARERAKSQDKKSRLGKLGDNSKFC
jgi:hypothetical protein